MDYEEALKRAKELWESGNALTRKQMEIVFPELRESEDERIRKELIGHCKDLVRMNKDDKVMLSIYEPWLAWLEKQKEQKPVKYGDDVVEEAEEYTSKVDCGEYGVEVTEAYIAGVLSEWNRKLVEWSEFDNGALEDAICATDTLGNDESFNKSNPNLAKAFRVAKDWLKSLPERFNLQLKQE